MLRLSLMLVVCVGGSLTMSVGASAASMSGPSSAPFGTTVTLTAHYGQGEPFGCGAGINFCYATVYGYRADGTKSLFTYCGDPISGDASPCSFQVGAEYGGERILTDPSYAKYEVCEGVDSGCSSKLVTWDPPVLDLSLTGVANGDGSVRAKVTGGEHGLLGGHVQLYDENRGKSVPGVYEDDGARYWNLEGCAGPYFRATWTLGEETRRTGYVRINGIASNGEPCHDDPPGGGDGGGGGSGGGDTEPPPPPTAIIDGPASVSALETAELTVRPSSPTEFPYRLVVRDTSDDNRVVGSCQANADCVISLFGDPGATEPEVHHLVAETHLGLEVVATGGTKDVTFVPFRTQAQIKSITVSEPAVGVASAGTVNVQIANADRGPAFAYELYLEARDVTNPGSQWTYIGSCARPRLICDLEYVAAPHDADGGPRTIKFRATISYLGEVRDRSPVRTVRLLGGMDYDALMAALRIPAVADAVCEEVIVRFNHLGRRFAGTTLNHASAACAGMIAGGAAAALAWLVSQPDAAGELGSILGSVINTIRDITTSVDVPSVGGAGGGTTSGEQIYREQIEAIARSLRNLNRGVGELTLETAKAVAAACLAVSAYNRMSVIVGVPLGPGFCKNPTMPIFIVGADANEAAQHKFDAIFGHAGKGIPARPGWAVLNYAMAETKIAAGQNRGWYRYLAPCAGKVQKGVIDCDEYPYFSSSQGSGFAVPRPSIRPINAPQNQLEGRQLNAMRKRCEFESSGPITATSNGDGGTRYLVLPMPNSEPEDSDVGPFWKPSPIPSPFTFGLCNRGGGGSSGGGAS